VTESESSQDGLRRLSQRTRPLHRIRETRLDSLHLHGNGNIGADSSQLLDQGKSALTRKQTSASRLSHQINRATGRRVAQLEPREHTSIAKLGDRSRILTKAIVMQRVDHDLASCRLRQEPRVATGRRSHPRHVLKGDNHAGSARLTTEPTQSFLGLGEPIQIRDHEQLAGAGPNRELHEPRHIRIGVGTQPNDFNVVQDDTSVVAASPQVIGGTRRHITRPHSAGVEPSRRRRLCHSGRLDIEHRPCREHQTSRIRHVADDRGGALRLEQQ